MAQALNFSMGFFFNMYYQYKCLQRTYHNFGSPFYITVLFLALKDEAKWIITEPKQKVVKR